MREARGICQVPTPGPPAPFALLLTTVLGPKDAVWAMPGLFRRVRSQDLPPAYLAAQCVLRKGFPDVQPAFSWREAPDLLCPRPAGGGVSVATSFPQC